jgi:hypothetical protein
VLVFCIAAGFWFTALGRADEYLPAGKPPPEPEPVPVVATTSEEAPLSQRGD